MKKQIEVVTLGVPPGKMTFPELEKGVKKLAETTAKKKFGLANDKNDFVVVRYNKIIRETEKAVCLSTKKDGIMWLPKSLITLHRDMGKVLMPTKMYLQKSN